MSTASRSKASRSDAIFGGRSGLEGVPGSLLLEPSFSGLQKGPAERGHVKKLQKPSKSVKSFSTLFDNFRAGQKTSKIVKKRQKVLRHFSTIFARHHFSGPFWGALILETGFGLLAQNCCSEKTSEDLEWLQQSEKSASEGSECQGDSLRLLFDQGPLKGGGFKRGGLPIWTCPSFFCLFWSFSGLSPFFRDFPDLLEDSSGIFPIHPFSCGLGFFHVKGWGPKSSVCPSKPGKYRTFSAGYPGILPGYPGGARKV